MRKVTIVLITVEIFCNIQNTFQSECGHLVTDFSQQTCIDRQDSDNNTYYYWKPECIPSCEKFQQEGEYP